MSVCSASSATLSLARVCLKGNMPKSEGCWSRMPACCWCLLPSNTALTLSSHVVVLLLLLHATKVVLCRGLLLLAVCALALGRLLCPQHGLHLRDKLHGCLTVKGAHRQTQQHC